MFDQELTQNCGYIYLYKFRLKCMNIRYCWKQNDLSLFHVLFININYLIYSQYEHVDKKYYLLNVCIASKSKNLKCVLNKNKWYWKREILWNPGFTGKQVLRKHFFADTTTCILKSTCNAYIMIKEADLSYYFSDVSLKI